MLRIGEFSSLGQVTVKALRFYDDAGLLRPMHVDPATNYRYYSIEQLPRLHRVLAFKDLGFTLEQIAAMLDENFPAARIRDMLLLKQVEIARRVEEEETLLKRVEARLRLIEDEGGQRSHNVVVKRVPAQVLLSARRVMPTVVDMDRFSRRVGALLSEQDVPACGPLCHVYHHHGYREVDLDVEVGVPVAVAAVSRCVVGNELKFTSRELALVPRMAALIVSGSDDISTAYSSIGRWIYSNGYSVTGPCREIYHARPAHDDHGAIHIIEIQYPVMSVQDEPDDVHAEGVEL